MGTNPNAPTAAEGIFLDIFGPTRPPGLLLLLASHADLQTKAIEKTVGPKATAQLGEDSLPDREL